jgi:hypothetical protein
MKSLLVAIGTALCTLIITACAVDGSPSPRTDNSGGEDGLGELSSALSATGTFSIDPGASQAALATAPPGWTIASVAGMPAGAVLVASNVVPFALICPSGFVCLYQDANLSGNAVAFNGTLGVGSSFLGSFNDKMTSWENISGRQYCWWFDLNFTGEVHTMPSGFQVNVLPRENDKASSVGPC